MKDLDVIEIEEKELKDMTKAELLALIEQQKKAETHLLATKEHNDKLIKSMRDNSIDMQKEFEEAMTTTEKKVGKIVTHFGQKIDGLSQIMQGSLTLLHADKVLAEEEEN